MLPFKGISKQIAKTRVHREDSDILENSIKCSNPQSTCHFYREVVLSEFRLGGADGTNNKMKFSMFIRLRSLK